MYTIQLKQSENEFHVECPACNNQIVLYHKEWSAILCTKCGVELQQEQEQKMSDYKKIDIPMVVIAHRHEERMTIMTPTDAILYLNSDECNDEDIHWVVEGQLECGMQKLVDILICHPEFFPCLDIAIDSDPRDRKINRLLMKAKKQPEN